LQENSLFLGPAAFSAMLHGGEAVFNGQEPSVPLYCINPYPNVNNLLLIFENWGKSNSENLILRVTISAGHFALHYLLMRPTQCLTWKAFLSIFP